MSRILYNIFISLFISLPCAFSQSAKDDFNKIEQVIKNPAGISMEVEYRVYPDSKSMTPLQVEKGIVYRKGDHIYHKVGDIETITTPGYQLIVDHQQKVIVLLGIITDKTMQAGMDVDLNAVLAKCPKVAYAKLPNGIGSYLLNCPGEEFKSFEIQFTGKNHYLHKLILNYKDEQAFADGPLSAPRMEMSYTNISTRPVLSPSLLTYEQFLLKEGNTYSCKKAYSDYELINNLFKQNDSKN